MAKKKGVLVKKIENDEIVKKTKSPYTFKSLNDSLQQKALLASEAQVFKLNQEGKLTEPILLQISTVLPTSKFKSKDHTRRMIRIPNRLHSIKNTSILLVTRDPVDTFRIPLTDKTAVTTNTFTSIIGFKKFKSMVGTSKKALKTFHEYDIIIVDNKLHKFLPKLLSSTIFCKSSQNYPLMLQMALPNNDVNANNEKNSRETVDIDYIQAQIKAWCKNTTFVPSTGPLLSVIVGYPSMSGTQIIENIDAVLTFLTDKNSQPIGGGVITDGMGGILDLHLFANDKSVPILKKSDRI